MLNRCHLCTRESRLGHKYLLDFFHNHLSTRRLLERHTDRLCSYDKLPCIHTAKLLQNLHHIDIYWVRCNHHLCTQTHHGISKLAHKRLNLLVCIEVYIDKHWEIDTLHLVICMGDRILVDIVRILIQICTRDHNHTEFD